jgi:threonine aldolase
MRRPSQSECSCDRKPFLQCSPKKLQRLPNPGYALRVPSEPTKPPEDPRWIDLRSDTVTQPSAEMREVMRSAEVGDDVYGEDPSVNRFEAQVAALFEKEAGLFVTSGTMGNQLAIAGHTRHGDEVFVGQEAHVAWFESGAAGALSGVQLTALGQGGFLLADDIRKAFRAPAYYQPRTSLVCFENTNNLAGGKVFPLEALNAACLQAHDLGLKTHLDGARLWNASVATGTNVRVWARHMDSVSVCFSKGLGAPVGSVLLGSSEFIREARTRRKRWGGGMRQAGILTAAAAYALEANLAGLEKDHLHARMLWEAIAASGLPSADALPPETNIVKFRVAAEHAALVQRRCEAKGVRIGVVQGGYLRAVTHRDIAAADIKLASQVLREALEAVFGMKAHA